MDQIGFAERTESRAVPRDHDDAERGDTDAGSRTSTASEIIAQPSAHSTSSIVTCSRR